ncbi:flagellin [Pseudomonas psychrophila]|uniref:flagellin N-terminal helical domain-containing protein n=1 Tax=Pseudomonas psychrophila TaxID=122355 RepID=UPI00035746F0|nr:flagellin [Pseudomonas psychrophila]EPJ91162.1 flagellin FliC [Pseudomonas psychrophila]
MALSVNTNITSQTVQKNLNKAGDALSTSMTRLSSGLKINSAKDDAAGMQMANRLTSQTKGMTVAIANANNGTSIAQTAEGAMQESTNILQRLRELALQSANGDKSDADRASLQQEFTAKTGELTRIAQTTTYGGRNILDGSFQNQAFQVGADANQTISFGMSDISATGLKGSYSEATTSGAALAGLSATTTSASLSTVAATVVAGSAPVATTAGEKFTINGKEITLTGAALGKAGGDEAASDINDQLATTNVRAVADAGGKLTLTSTDGKAIELGDVGAGTTLNKLGLTAGKTEVSEVPKLTGDVIGSKGDISVNGNAVAWSDTETYTQVLAKIQTAAGAGAKAELADGRIKVTTGNGSDIKLANTTTGGSLAQLGLSAGTSQAKLKEDTSIELNGVEVKFKKGDTSDTIVSSINSASTGVTASKNADGTLKLFSNKDITIKDGAAGTGLADLGLTPATGKTDTTKATTVETNVASLSVLTAADSQRTVQALSDAIQQIDTQRSALGAVQNRFTSTVANLQSISENSTAALGRVQDTDFASEAAELTKQQTLQQASTAILSQANQLPSAVMKLLQ